ncbi:hypothetical protein WN51_01091 [Melipona quadrifasciata]|uniref:Uncharacterized protein n=1 Tax=Melipona quadrifasciata TaxID=166423 RepID=A0A0M8ZYL4_9HYME|nr:hypothetical protein WN51_01091 [Melipona quadrifasciata]
MARTSVLARTQRPYMVVGGRSVLIENSLVRAYMHTCRLSSVFTILLVLFPWIKHLFRKTSH